MVRKGDKIVQMNYDAIDAGATGVVKSQMYLQAGKMQKTRALHRQQPETEQDVVDFVNDIQMPVNAQEGQ